MAELGLLPRAEYLFRGMCTTRPIHLSALQPRGGGAPGFPMRGSNTCLSVGVTASDITERHSAFVSLDIFRITMVLLYPNSSLIILWMYFSILVGKTKHLCQWWLSNSKTCTLYVWLTIKSTIATASSWRWFCFFQTIQKSISMCLMSFMDFKKTLIWLIILVSCI